MLFVLADVVYGRYTQAWLVPSPVFDQLAKVRNNETRRFSASLKPGATINGCPIDSARPSFLKPFSPASRS